MTLLHREPCRDTAERTRNCCRQRSGSTADVPPSIGTSVEDSVSADNSVIPTEESVALAPSAPAKSPESDIQPEGFRSASWLLQQAPQLFTLQMASLSSMARAVSFVDRQPDPEAFAIYRAVRGGRELYVVTYGVYSDRAAASRAADQLTGELAGMQPWIRELSLVQEAVREGMAAESN